MTPAPPAAGGAGVIVATVALVAAPARLFWVVGCPMQRRRTARRRQTSLAPRRLPSPVWGVGRIDVPRKPLPGALVVTRGESPRTFGGSHRDRGRPSVERIRRARPEADRHERRATTGRPALPGPGARRSPRPVPAGAPGPGPRQRPARGDARGRGAGRCRCSVGRSRGPTDGR